MQALKSILKEKGQTRIFFILGLFLIFFISLQAPTDPDFGWHLKIGQDILANHTISHFDPYSFTMSDFPWISYSWLSDIFVALFQKLFGFFGLSIIFSLITAAAFFLVARAYQTELSYQIIAALLGSILSVSVVGIRDQIWSVLGLAILIFIILRWRNNPHSKIIWWLPLLFVIWTNIHPGFVAGLVLFVIFIIFESFKYKRLSPELVEGITAQRQNFTLRQAQGIKFWLLAIFFLSLAATLLNPYGLRIYEEVWRTLSDFAGRSQIIEWRPLFSAGMDVFLPTVFFALFLFGAQFFAKKHDFTLIALSAIFFVFALLAWRNLPLFFIASSPLAVLTIENFTGKNLLDLIKTPTILLIIFALAFYAGWHNIKQVWVQDTNPQTLAKEANFPYGAVKFLASNHLPLATDHLFNEYNWGGYILWQMPNQKVFIDGRMVHWKLPSKHIFDDYQILQAAKNLNQTNSLIEKYNLNLALIRPDSPLAFYLSAIGWQKIYRDDLTIILKK